MPRYLLIVAALAVVLMLATGTNPAAVVQLGAYIAVDFSTRGARLTDATDDGAGNIVEPPAVLADQAAARLGRSVSLDAATMARMLRSEAGARGQDGKILRAHVAINDAAALGKSIHQTIIAGSPDGSYGKQAPRRYSTARDGYENDLQIAEAVIADRAAGGPDLGLGATKFVNSNGIADMDKLVTKWGKEGLAPVFNLSSELDLVLFAKGGAADA